MTFKLQNYSILAKYAKTMHGFNNFYGNGDLHRKLRMSLGRDVRSEYYAVIDNYLAVGVAGFAGTAGCDTA